MAVKECCKNLDNRERVTDTQTRCKVCQANHYKLIAETGHLGLEGGSLGGK